MKPSPLSKITAPDPGIYPGTDGRIVGSWQAASISTLKHYERSALHARHHMIAPKVPSAAMDNGRAIHCAVFEPERFRKEYVVAPKFNRKFKAQKLAWEAFQAEHIHHEIIDETVYDSCDAISTVLYEHPICAELLESGGKSEVAVVWQDEGTGATCKAILDYIGSLAEWTVVCDLKTTRDARRGSFERDAYNLHYDAQAAFYLDGLSAIDPFERKWMWIAVESAEPYGVIVYEADSELMESGREKYRGWLDTHHRCTASKRWPGYDPKVQVLELPRWVKR